MATATELKSQILNKAAEDSATTAHLVLPPSPRLTETEMEKVAGGVFIWGYV